MLTIHKREKELPSYCPQWGNWQWRWEEPHRQELSRCIDQFSRETNVNRGGNRQPIINKFEVIPNFNEKSIEYTVNIHDESEEFITSAFPDMLRNDNTIIDISAKLNEIIGEIKQLFKKDLQCTNAESISGDELATTKLFKESQVEGSILKHRSLQQDNLEEGFFDTYMKSTEAPVITSNIY